MKGQGVPKSSTHPKHTETFVFLLTKDELQTSIHTPSPPPKKMKMQEPLFKNAVNVNVAASEH